MEYKNKANSSTKYCTKCNIELKENINIRSKLFNISQYQCFTCRRKTKNERERNWRKKNPTAYNDIIKKYRINNKEKINEIQKKYQLKNKDKRKKYFREYARRQQELFNEEVSKDMRDELKQSIDTEELFKKVYNKLEEKQ